MSTKHSALAIQVVPVGQADVGAATALACRVFHEAEHWDAVTTHRCHEMVTRL